MAGPDAIADIAASKRTTDDANGLCAPPASASAIGRRSAIDTALAIGTGTSFARRSAERPFSPVATAANCRPPRHPTAAVRRRTPHGGSLIMKCRRSSSTG